MCPWRSLGVLLLAHRTLRQSEVNVQGRWRIVLHYSRSRSSLSLKIVWEYTDLIRGSESLMSSQIKDGDKGSCLRLVSKSNTTIQWRVKMLQARHNSQNESLLLWIKLLPDTAVVIRRNCLWHKWSFKSNSVGWWSHGLGYCLENRLVVGSLPCWFGGMNARGSRKPPEEEGKERLHLGGRLKLVVNIYCRYIDDHIRRSCRYVRVPAAPHTLIEFDARIVVYWTAAGCAGLAWLGLAWPGVEVIRVILTL